MALEHGHVMSLTHHGPDEAYVICACGTGSTIMRVEHIGDWITNHRLDKFWKVRFRLQGLVPSPRDYSRLVHMDAVA